MIATDKYIEVMVPLIVQLWPDNTKDEEGVKDTGRVEKVISKVRAKAEEYGADPDMVEALYREMISRFVSMEMKEFNEMDSQ